MEIDRIAKVVIILIVLQIIIHGFRPPRLFKYTWVVLKLIKGFCRLGTFFIRGKAQPVCLKLHPGAGIASGIPTLFWLNLNSILVDGH